MDRLVYALLGAGFVALLGLVGWWLYGLGFSLYDHGPGIHPHLDRWATALAIVFGVLGFVFKERVGSYIGSAVAAVFSFEDNR